MSYLAAAEKSLGQAHTREPIQDILHDYPYPCYYPFYYPSQCYKYHIYLGDGQSLDYGIRRSGELTTVGETALTKRGYYQGPIDGMTGTGSRRAIRASKDIRDCPSPV